MPDQPPTLASLKPRRSVLYMPGSNARALEKARSLPADSVILDLEDAVAPELKGEARNLVCAAVRQGFGHREVIVRINSLSSPWAEQDLRDVAAAKPDAILIPKTSTARDVTQVADALTRSDDGGSIAIWAMIEAPLAVLNLREIASAGQRLQCLVLGTNDLIKELQAIHTADRSNLAYVFGQLIVTARAYGLAVIDGVHNAIADMAGFEIACAQARSFGFDGKTVIHPSQIEPANTAFAPSPAEIEAAGKIVHAFALPENAGKGAIKVDGRMVERLHADMAERALALHAVISAR